jgi:hypothetical protein
LPLPAMTSVSSIPLAAAVAAAGTAADDEPTASALEPQSTSKSTGEAYGSGGRRLYSGGGTDGRTIKVSVLEERRQALKDNGARCKRTE